MIKKRLTPILLFAIFSYSQIKYDEKAYENYQTNLIETKSIKFNEKSNYIEIKKCTEASSDKSIFSILEIKNELVIHNEFDLEPTIYISDNDSNIEKILISDISSSSNFCRNIEYRELYDIAIDKKKDIYLSIAEKGIVKVSSDRCEFNQILDIEAPYGLSFDLKNNLYFDQNSMVMRVKTDNIKNYELWHDFEKGKASGDFVILENKMYIAWSIDTINSDLYEVTINENGDYISHINLGRLPANTYGLASELGMLYGVSAKTLYRIDLDRFKFETIFENDKNTNWFGASGEHESIYLNVSLYDTYADATLDKHEITKEHIETEGTSIFAKITNTHTGESYIQEIKLKVIIPDIVEPEDIYRCDVYTLPTLKNSRYFIYKNNEIKYLNALEEIKKTQEIFIENIPDKDLDCKYYYSFHVLIGKDIQFDNIERCNSYTLPKLDQGNFYTNPLGQGKILAPQQEIIESQIVYYYDTSNNCIKDTSFSVKIEESKIETLELDLQICENEQIALYPLISSNIKDTSGKWLGPSNLNGNHLGVFDGFNNAEGTYNYSILETNICLNYHASINILKHKIPELPHLNHQTVCGNFEIPTTENGKFYLLPNGEGEVLEPFDLIEETTIIYLYAKNENCDNEKSVAINIEKQPNAGEDKKIKLCADEIINLYDLLDIDSDKNGLWHQINKQNYDDDIIINPEINETGIYRYTVAGNSVCAESSSQIELEMVAYPEITETHVKRLNDDEYQISITLENESKYEYSIDGGKTFQSEPYFTNIQHGNYTILVQDIFGCNQTTESESLHLLGFPNFFTPNGDGFNDEWGVEGMNDEISGEVIIFDRKGTILSKIIAGKTKWDGTINGNPLPQDDYWFQYIDSRNNIHKGHFSIVR